MFNMITDVSFHGSDKKFLFLTNLQAKVCLAQSLSISGLSLLLRCRCSTRPTSVDCSAHLKLLSQS